MQKIAESFESNGSANIIVHEMSEHRVLARVCKRRFSLWDRDSIRSDIFEPGACCLSSRQSLANL